MQLQGTFKPLQVHAQAQAKQRNAYIHKFICNAHRCKNDEPTLSQQQLTCSLSAYLAKSLSVAVNPSGIFDGIRAYISGLGFTRVTFFTIHKASQVWPSCVCRGWVLQLELDFSLTFCSCLNIQLAFGASF